MQASPERPFCLDDFAPLLKELAESEDESVLIGGLAVSAWAELFLHSDERLLFDPPAGTALRPEEGLTLLDPCSLFICKLHAANTRPKGEAGNDAKHLAILARVIPRFLEKLRASSVPEYDGKEDVTRLLQQIEASEVGRHPFRVPLAAEEISTLCEALLRHLD
jgi:transglutaminase-like putative cysteine protease